MRLPSAFAPLRHRDFRLLWTGQGVSFIGDLIHSVALPFQILALGGGAFELAIWSGTLSVVHLILSLLGGAISDRVPRRTVILVSDLSAGVLVAVVAVLSALGVLRLEHLYVEAALFGAVEAFLHPAASAIIPELVPADILQAGNALQGMSRQIGFLVGPVAGGILVALAGMPVAFAVDAATFVFSFGAFALAKPPPHEAPPAAPLHRQVREGLAYTFSIPWLWIFIFAWALVLLGEYGPRTVGLPILVRDVLGGDARMFGVITAATGVGQIVTGLVLGQVKIRRLGVGICVFAVIGALATMGIGLVPHVAATIVFATILGVEWVGLGVLWVTAVQKHVPRDKLGRVMSIDAFGGGLLLPIAPAAFAVVVAAVGPAPAFVIGGGFALVVVVGLLFVPSIRSLE
jgi:MFS family permease